jgi:hypothetical protein
MWHRNILAQRAVGAIATQHFVAHQGFKDVWLFADRPNQTIEQSAFSLEAGGFVAFPSRDKRKERPILQFQD